MAEGQAEDGLAKCATSCFFLTYNFISPASPGNRPCSCSGQPSSRLNLCVATLNNCIFPASSGNRPCSCSGQPSSRLNLCVAIFTLSGAHGTRDIGLTVPLAQSQAGDERHWSDRPLDSITYRASCASRTLLNITTSCHNTNCSRSPTDPTRRWTLELLTIWAAERVTAPSRLDGW